MPRPKLPPERRRRDITITPDPRILDWVEANTGPGKRFHNRTHAFEYGVAKLMEEEAVAKGGGPAVGPVDSGLAKAAHDFLQRPANEKGQAGAGEKQREKRKH